MFVFEWLLVLANNVFARQGFLLKNGELGHNYTIDALHLQYDADYFGACPRAIGPHEKALMKLNHPVGAQAEDQALAFLARQGLRLVVRNWHCAYGEVDLVMKEGTTWVFIEVKYRQRRHFGGAAYSITPHKLAKLQRTVLHYMQVNKIHNEACRLDAVLCQAQDAPVWLKNILG